MIYRQHERVVLDAEVTLYFPDKTSSACQTLDVSLGGLKVTSTTSPDLFKHIGDECLVELVLDVPDGIEMKQFFLQAKATMVNGDPAGAGLAFQGLDEESQVLLEKLIKSQLYENDLDTLHGKAGVAVKARHDILLKTHLKEHIVYATKEIFIAFLSIDITPGPYVERPDFDAYAPPESEVTGIVLFSGAVEGGIHLSSPLHFAVKAAGAMMGEAGLDLATEQEAMVWDALGEITNQIAGGVQTRLSDQFEGINLTAPNVVVGADFSINYSKKLTSVRQFFMSPFGPFFVECFFY